MNKSKFTSEDIWQGIILFGLNAATYKMALANSLLDLSSKGMCEVNWKDLSESFLKQYINRLALKNMPQQGVPSRLTVMERVVMNLGSGTMTYEEAIDTVSTIGLENVVPRFQTIGRNKEIVNEHFYEFEFGKKLVIKDSLLSFSPDVREELRKELLARWSLLEGAFSISIKNFDLSNDIRKIYLIAGHERTNLTENIPFLSGYQGNACFYCGEPLYDNVHVDHVLPRQVLHHDEIWNLVLAHPECNLRKSDRLVGPHFIKKLIARNENIMGSNHPWKNKIYKALGKTPQKRAAELQRHYDNVKKVLGAYWWEGTPWYNPSNDPFYRKLITALNNPNIGSII